MIYVMEEHPQKMYGNSTEANPILVSLLANADNDSCGANRETASRFGRQRGHVGDGGYPGRR